MSRETMLILGGARSGKSARAETLVRAGRGRPIYLATAEIRDDEMRSRVERHRRDRGSDWTTIEEPLDLPGVFRAARPNTPILVECLTLWLSNLMEAGRDPAAATEDLIAALAAFGDTAVLVANEVGWGIVPDNALARDFRDEAGRMNRRIAAIADRVELVVAGLPLTIKAPTSR